MSSNSENMTVAAKLALNLKESALGALLGPDEVEQLAKDAIQLAFFQPQRIPKGYGGYDTADPVIVLLAREQFKAAFAEAAKPLIAKIVESDEFRQALMTAAVAAVPEMLRSYGIQLANDAMNRAYQSSVERTQQLIGSINLGGR